MSSLMSLGFFLGGNSGSKWFHANKNSDFKEQSRLGTRPTKKTTNIEAQITLMSFKEQRLASREAKL